MHRLAWALLCRRCLRCSGRAGRGWFPPWWGSGSWFSLGKNIICRLPVVFVGPGGDQVLLLGFAPVGVALALARRAGLALQAAHDGGRALQQGLKEFLHVVAGYAVAQDSIG